MKTSSQETLDAYGCPSSFIVPVRLSDLPTLVPALPHMVTGTQAQRATLLCPQPVVPCRLSIHRAVCPWVSCRLRRSHVGCPHNGMSVDPSWTPQVACISVHTTALTSHFPAWSIHRPGPDSHFPHNQDLIPRLSGPRPLAGSAPLCPPDY